MREGAGTAPWVAERAGSLHGRAPRWASPVARRSVRAATHPPSPAKVLSCILWPRGVDPRPVLVDHPGRQLRGRPARGHCLEAAVEFEVEEALALTEASVPSARCHRDSVYDVVGRVPLQSRPMSGSSMWGFPTSSNRAPPRGLVVGDWVAGRAWLWRRPVLLLRAPREACVAAPAHLPCGSSPRSVARPPRSFRQGRESAYATRRTSGGRRSSIRTRGSTTAEARSTCCAASSSPSTAPSRTTGLS